MFSSLVSGSPVSTASSSTSLDFTPTSSSSLPNIPSLSVDDFTSFNSEDVEVLEAFCVEVSTLIHRFLSDAILQNMQIEERDSVLSLVELYTKQPNSKNGKRESLVGAKLFGRQASMSSIVIPKIPWPVASASPAELHSFSFNVWQYNPDDLCAFAYDIFEQLGFVQSFNIPPSTLQSFVLAVRSKYRANPFHNWYHGFAVMHFAYLFLRLTNAGDYLNQVEMMAILVSALCHDIDHPGRTNTFEINAETELALLHNDQSVLENHHANTMFFLLQNSECNIFVNMSKDARRSARKMMISAILATDMSHHFDASRDLESRNAESPFDKTKESDRHTLAGCMVHASDLSAQTLHTSIAKVWEERISQEFDAQAAEESKLGLPVAPFMQNLSNGVHRAKLQVNFITFVLEPYWKAVVRLFPALKVCIDNLQSNKQFFQSLAQISSPASS